MDKALYIIGRIIMIPVYTIIAILWLGIVPALLFGMLKAAIYTIFDIKP
jgi:hypothetical protein